MTASRRTIPLRVLASFGAAMVLVIGGGVVALREQGQTFRVGEESRHALEVLVGAERLRSALVDAETGQRGYLLTGRESYLEPYQRGVAGVAEDLARLRDMTKEDAGQQARLAVLEPLVTSKLAELRQTIETRRSGDESRALAIVRTDAGKQAMENIRALLDQFDADETQRLGTLLGIRAAHRDRALTTIAVVTGAGALTMLLALVLVTWTDRARRRAEEQARATQERLQTVLREQLADTEMRARAVLDTTVSAIISIDEHGRIETFNQAAERLFGYEAAAVMGQNVRVLMPSPYQAEHDGYLHRYLETGERRIIGIGREVTGLRKDGTTFPMALAVADTVLHGQHIFTGVIRDLTQEKAAEERERQLTKHALQNERLADIGAVTARIAHDFGNPLAGLQMTTQRLLQLLARDPVPLERVRQGVDIMAAAVRYLDALVTEFKEFAREQRLDLRDLDLPAFLLEVVAGWEQEATGRGIILEAEMGEVVPSIRADEGKLRRVIENLLKNALEAIDRGPGLVRVSAESQKPESVRIVVADTGPGIPTGLDVFALFESTKALGTGLGLPICKQIVQAHGGGIEYASHPPEGTVFWIELPTHGPT